MKIVYRVCCNLEKKQVQKLREFELEFKIGEVDCKEIEEQKYIEIKELLNNWDINPTRHIEFEKSEVLDSSYSIITGYSPVGGYPMPDNLEYQPLTYNIDNWCMSCGCGLKQNSEFRLKKLPNFKKKIFGINWVYDVLFVEKEYYKSVFEPLGLESRSVKLYKSDSIIEGIVQLEIPTIEDNLDLKDYSFNICPKCNHKKYLPSPVGFFPIQQNPLPNIFLSREYFGSGASASKKIFISKLLRDKLIQDKNMLWEWFAPCK